MKTFKEYLGEETKLDEAHCGCGGNDPCDCDDDCSCRESVEEAVGDAAAPIYDLIDELGSHQIVLDELIRYLDVDQIADFVADFRRHNDMNETSANEDAYIAELKKLAGVEENISNSPNRVVPRGYYDKAITALNRKMGNDNRAGNPNFGTGKDARGMPRTR